MADGKTVKLCQIEPCDERHYCKGYCRYHYDQNRRRGNPFISGPIRKPPKRTPVVMNNLAYIPLSDNGLGVAIIDAVDLPLVGSYNWCRHSMGYYAQASIYGQRILLHNVIMGQKAVDHVNGDKLDNRRSNLRKGPQYLNMGNIGLSSHNTSGYKGVSWNKKKNKWEANIQDNRKKRFLGYFETKENAAEAYNKRALEQWGEYARLNNTEKGGVT